MVLSQPSRRRASAPAFLAPLITGLQTQNDANRTLDDRRPYRRLISLSFFRLSPVPLKRQRGEMQAEKKRGRQVAAPRERRRAFTQEQLCVLLCRRDETRLRRAIDLYDARDNSSRKTACTRARSIFITRGGSALLFLHRRRYLQRPHRSYVRTRVRTYVAVRARMKTFVLAAT